ncbi:caspase family protein [Streptomyces lutosisoli]|uniref:Caspase family protein n=1 Tax=Streptomyces lutosisoli TaxID=2665721 RepID=A0ABW2VNC7_9ACTN
MNGDLPDPSASRVVLIGGSEYRSLVPLPPVSSNLQSLCTTLQDPTICGIPEANCTVVKDPQLPSEFLDPVANAAATARDTLLVYYSGHGLRDTDDPDLYMALRDSQEGRGYTAVAYNHLRSVVRMSPARRRIVILDCCFSGRAARAMSADVQNLAAQAKVEGTYVLAASPGDRPALAPEGEVYTTFTGELLDLLRGGIPDGPELIDLETIYRTLEGRLRAKNKPLPQRTFENQAGLLPIARNRACAPARGVGGPVLDLQVTSAITTTGLRLARRLRAVGRTRDALPVLRLILGQPGTTEGGDDILVRLELADILTELDHGREAIEVLETAFVAVHNRAGPEVLTVCRRLAALLREMGSHAEACDVLEHALKLSFPAEAPLPPPTAGGLT